MSRRSARVLSALLVAAALLVSGCGDDDDDTAATSTSEAEVSEGLPPAASTELEPIYGAALADLGLRLTDRGGLIDRSGGGYEPSAAGTHLALYVEPVGTRTNAEYVEGIGTVAAVFGDVFDRWPGLTSYDVCQEPADDGEGDVDEPLPVTQIELTAEEATAFDWEVARSVDLVRASLASPPGATVRVSTALGGDPAYEAVLAEAGA